MNFYHVFLLKGKKAMKLCGDCFTEKKDAIAYGKQQLKESQVEGGKIEFNFIEYTSYKIVSKYDKWEWGTEKFLFFYINQLPIK